MNVPTLKIIEDLADIPAAEWNALAAGDPFLSHGYLYALQLSGCATAANGWQAQFITLWQDDHLLGAIPLYLKMNSYGLPSAWSALLPKTGMQRTVHTSHRHAPARSKP